MNYAESIESVIEEYFGHIDPDDIDPVEDDFDTLVTSIFRVQAIRLDSEAEIDVSHFLTGALYEHVLVPEEVHELLRAHDLYMMTIGARGPQWFTVWMGPIHH